MAWIPFRVSLRKLGLPLVLALAVLNLGMSASTNSDAPCFPETKSPNRSAKDSAEDLKSKYFETFAPLAVV